MSTDSSPWDDDPHVLKPNSTQKDFLEYLGITTDYASFPICIASIIADVLLISVVLKYKRLKNRNNFYLVNFAVFHIGYIVSTPLFYIVLDIFYDSALEVHWYCVWIRVENFAIGLILSFAAGLGVDAVLERVRPSWFTTYQRRYVYVFCFLYFFHFLMYFTAACVCLKVGFNNNFNFYFLTCYYFLLLGIVFYAVRKEKTASKRTFALQVAAVILLCWLPLFVLYNLMNIFKEVHQVEHVLWYLAFIPEYVAYCCSLLVLWRLWKRNKHFMVAFKSVFRRRVTDSEYEELNSRVDDGDRGL